MAQKKRPGAPRIWNKRNITQAIRDWNEQFGAPPTAADWRRVVPGYPGYSSVAKNFGSWNKAIAAAGFKPIAAGQQREPALKKEEPAPEATADISLEQINAAITDLRVIVRNVEQVSGRKMAEVVEEAMRPFRAYVAKRLDDIDAKVMAISPASRAETVEEQRKRHDLLELKLDGLVGMVSDLLDLQVAHKPAPTSNGNGHHEERGLMARLFG